MKVNFDKKVDRKGTFCTQWDYVEDRFGKKDLLPFTISDMDFNSADEIIETINNRVNHKIFGYSRWNHSEFKGAIVNWYKKRFDTDIKEEWIVYSPSVIYSISKFIEIYSEKNDGILTLTPAYDAFYKLIKANDRKLVTSSLIFKEENYEINYEDFEEKCKIAKVFILCNPHNPTGRVWKFEELEMMIKICLRNNVKIISDDIHMDITYKRKFTPILKFDESKDIIICSSPSKTFNIPALTGSYIIIPNEQNKDEFLEILKNKDGLSSPSIFNVVGTIEAYNKCDYWIDQLNEYTFENIKFVDDFLKKNIEDLKIYIPDGCYFVLINFESLNISSELMQKYLIEVGNVAIMPGNTYGKELDLFLRMNIGCSREKLVEGLNRLKKAVDHIKKEVL